MITGRPVPRFPDAGSYSDDELLMHMLYQLAGSLNNPVEENTPSFCTSQGIPLSEVRRLMKLVITRCDLPVPERRADEIILFHQGRLRNPDGLIDLSGKG